MLTNDVVFDYFQRLFRSTINDQIQTFKNKCFADTEFVHCAITGLQITKQLCEIDHAHPHTFAALVFKFLWGRFPDGVQGFFSEKVQTILEEWKAYHKQNARLRAVYCTANKKEDKIHPEWEQLLIPLKDRGEWWRSQRALMGVSKSSLLVASGAAAYQTMLNNCFLDWRDYDDGWWHDSFDSPNGHEERRRAMQSR